MNTGSLLSNNTGQRIIFSSRYGKYGRYLNTTTITGSSVQFSGIACDPGDGTVWSVVDTTGTPHVWNYSKGGTVYSNFSGATIDASIAELEGVTVNPNDFSLYFVSDTSGSPAVSNLWHCERDGTKIGEPIDLTLYGVQSAQEIEYDVFTDTLLVICNVTKKLYRLTLGGALIDIYNLSAITPQPSSWQGIAVDQANGNWWLSGHTPNVLVLVDPSTLEIILSLDVSGWPSMGSLTGVAFDPRYEKN